MKVLKIVIAPAACEQTEVDLPQWSSQAALTDAYHSDVLADLNRDNFVSQTGAGMQTISTVIGDTNIVYVRRCN